jgi:hypothetical protein
VVRNSSRHELSARTPHPDPLPGGARGRGGTVPLKNTGVIPGQAGIHNACQPFLLFPPSRPGLLQPTSPRSGWIPAFAGMTPWLEHSLASLTSSFPRKRESILKLIPAPGRPTAVRKAWLWRRVMPPNPGQAPSLHTRTTRCGRMIRVATEVLVRVVDSGLRRNDQVSEARPRSKTPASFRRRPESITRAVHPSTGSG